MGQHKKFSPGTLSSFREHGVFQPESWRLCSVLPGDLGQSFLTIEQLKDINEINLTVSMCF